MLLAILRIVSLVASAATSSVHIPRGATVHKHCDATTAISRTPDCTRGPFVYLACKDAPTAQQHAPADAHLSLSIRPSNVPRRPFLGTSTISIVIPALNEESRLEATLDTTERYLRATRSSAWEIIVVDDGSKDSTCSLVRGRGLSPRLRLLTSGYGNNRGKGAALAAGAAKARGRLILFLDADGATDLRELPALERRLRRPRCEMAVGWRVDAFRTRPLGRRLMGAVFAALARQVVTGVPDTQCGFKLLTRRAAVTLPPRLRVTGWTYDVDLLALAQSQGWIIASVPVRWNDVAGSKVRVFTPFAMLIDLVRLWAMSKVASLGTPTNATNCSTGWLMQGCCLDTDPFQFMEIAERGDMGAFPARQNVGSRRRKSGARISSGMMVVGAHGPFGRRRITTWSHGEVGREIEDRRKGAAPKALRTTLACPQQRDLA
mmetsp:Transcript_22579/g.68846  ORF Transcript_22579/g.68846 Transcript_22579/m.68846 type:complete len:434 (+) Transcript_22579:589-1890(+)